MAVESGRNPAHAWAHAVAARGTQGPAIRRRPTRRQFLVRRIVAVVLVLTLFAALVGTISILTRDGTPRVRTVGAPRSPVSAPGPPPAMEPGGGPTLFPSHRLVAFYGAAARPRLGVLGEAPPETLWPRLTKVAAAFASPATTVVPSYELIAFIAQSAAGSDGNYAEEPTATQIDSYLKVVRGHGGMLILDIQPGRSDLLSDAQRLEQWLVEPDVGLALDPEWELTPTQLPGKQFGQTSADEINGVSAWLQQLTVAHHLPQKLLMIHQFVPSMVENKAAVVARPNLAIAFNMDGFGTPANKVSVYQSLAIDTRWSLGYKIFYHRDRPLQTPEEILALDPAPLIIEYE